jgi:hypothetical protein
MNQKIGFGVIIVIIITIGTTIGGTAATIMLQPQQQEQQQQVYAAAVNPSINEINNINIKMKRNMCLGTCPVYSLEIFGNGTVVYNGERFVNVTGQQISNIPQEKVRKLVEEFYKINYFSFKDAYNEIVITDQPTVSTSINMSGIYKSVFDNHGAIAPEGLRLLENKIDETTNSSKWVQPYIQPPRQPIRP